jgi:hypothetical protein
VPEFCTCGAKLPEDARFCHKCGKPQRDEPLLVEEPTPPPLPLASVPKIPPIGLTNGLAVRIALLGGALSLALSVISGQVLSPGVSLLWLVVSGFVCVLLYRKRTGQKLTVLHGAHLGGICGLFVFTIMVVLFAASILSDPSSFQTALDTMREQLSASARPGVDVNQIMEVMRSPTGILFGLLGAFLLLTALPAFGGALGAKLLDRD